MLNMSKFVGGLALGVVLAFVSAFAADQLVATKPLAASVYKVAGLAVASPAQAEEAKPATAAEAAPAGDAAAPAATAEAAPAAAEAALEPVGPLLAKANAANGEKLAKVCATCHTFVKDGANKVGPNLYGIVGNHRAHLDGFAYSAAMKAQSGEKWDYESLNKYLNKPKDVVPGTKMAFAGLKKASDRADVIAYLRTLADSPVALP